MSDEMIDLTAGDARLRRRLEAYAERRLSPDLSTTSRMRARVLAHAHRHADLARADAALTIVSPSTYATTSEHGRRRRGRTLITLVAAALIAGAAAGGVAASSRPGGALYEPRLWVESVALPSDPSARAVAELSRLAERLREADTAASSGDQRALVAALGAYERIMSEASAAVLDAEDAVAAAAFETGVGRNVEVLQALIARVPPGAADAIGSAVERAIVRSNGAIHSVDAVDRPTPAGGNGSGGNASGGNASGGEAGGGNSGSGGGNAGGNSSGGGSNAAGQGATPKPAKTPPQQPVATPKPTRTDKPERTPKPTRTPRSTNPAQSAPASGDPPD
jgi:uncharacterized membrane protein YgcG